MLETAPSEDNVVHEKEVIFHEFDLETSELDFGVSKSRIWKHTTLCGKGVFSFIINISQLRRPIELKFTQVCYFMHILRYTKWENNVVAQFVCFRCIVTGFLQAWSLLIFEWEITFFSKTTLLQR